MDKKYPNILSLTQIIINFFLILGSFSILLFIMGYINYSFYSYGIGISKSFLDFQQYDYVANGLLGSIYIIFFLPLIYNVLDAWITLQKVKNKILNVKDKVGLISKKDRKSFENEVKKINYDFFDVEKLFWNELQKLLNIYKNIFILILILIVICYLLKITNLFFILVICIIQSLILYFVLYIFKLRKQNIINAIVYISFLFLFGIPAITGYLEAKSHLISNRFDSYTITMKNKTIIENAKFIYFGKGNYLFFVNKKLTLLPKEEIFMLEKNN